MANQIRGRTSFSRLTLLAGTAAVMASGTAFAAERAATKDANADTVTEVIVTAEKRETRLQDTPIAITSINQDQLRTHQVVTLDDLAFAVPNMRTDGRESISIRGVGNYANSTTSAAAADTNIDGIASASLGPELFDVQRVEILRGPQGTLYGRNTTAGVISEITTKPGDQFGGYLQADFGNYNTSRIEGAVDLPVNSAISERLSVLDVNRSGYVVNIHNGDHVDSRHYYALRSSTSLDIDPSTTATLVLNYSNEDDSRSALGKMLCTPDALDGCSINSRGYGSPNSNAPGNLFHSLYATFGLLAHPAADYNLTSYNPPNLREINTFYDPRHLGDTFLGAFELKHKFGAFEIVSDTGYSEVTSKDWIGYEQTAPSTQLLAPIAYSIDGQHNVTTTNLISVAGLQNSVKTYSQELRLNSELAGPFNYTAGLYYGNSLGSNKFDVWSPALALFQQLVLPGVTASDHVEIATPQTKLQTSAIYGEAYYNIMPETKLTSGLRYTEDRVSVTTRTILLAPPTPYVHESEKYSAVTGKVGVDQKLNLAFTDSSLVYANISRGYKAGGLNPGAPAGSPAVYAPEYINAVQVGSKNAMDHGRIVANVEVFYYDYKGLQLSQSTSTGTENVNADATVYGAEGEFQFRATEALRFDLNLAYLHTRIDRFFSCNAAIVAPCIGAGPSQAGNVLPRSPDFSGNLGVQYTVAMPRDWQMTARINGYYQSSFYASVFNTPADNIGGWGKADASVTFANAARNLQFMAYVKNLTNANNIQTADRQGASVGGFLNVTLIDPRLYGVEMRTRF